MSHAIGRHWLVAISIAASAALAGCGGGGDGGSTASAATQPPPPPPPTYSIGGVVSGAAASGLVLQNNGGNNLSVSGNGTFNFATKLLNGTAYNVSVLASPPLQLCSVANGTGTVGTADVANVAISCVASFSIGQLLDPLAIQQWHLVNTGQNAYADVGGVAGMDINVNPVWQLGHTGNNVVAAVLDSGLEINHEDLRANVIAGGSWNFVNSTTDPTNTATTGDHGTSVGGLIAAAQNNLGGIGVAPNAKLKGFNVLRAQSTPNFLDALGGSSASPNSSDVLVFNQSYGTGLTFDAPIDQTIESQYLSGVTTLRGGRGAVYVKSAGNGFIDLLPSVPAVLCSLANAAGTSCQNTNFDAEATIPYQIVVGATNAHGMKSSYSTAGSSIWVSAPGGEYGGNSGPQPGQPAAFYQPAMITVDQSGCTSGYSRTGAIASVFDTGGSGNTTCNYTSGFNGTSSAAPVLSGVIALMLEANPQLTWRDVKHILASTSRQIDPARAAVNVLLSDGNFVSEPAWTTNAANFKFHNWYGFGMVNASVAVNMAKTYTAGQLGTFKNTGWIVSPTLIVPIPDNSVLGTTHTLPVPGGSASTVEAVQILLSASHTFSGDIAIELTSPSGTRSVLKNGNDVFTFSDDLNLMVLLSNAFYGESAIGTWTIKIVDVAAGDVGSLIGWAIRVYGR